LGQEAWPPSFWSFSFYFLIVFIFIFIYCVHAFEFRARSTTPLSFGSSFFYLLAIFFFVLLYCVRVYQNQCYMCTKINVIQWLASSGRLVLRKNSCNLDGVPIRHAVLEITCEDFGPKCWELKFLI
jgi:hypothetical protein